MFDEKLSLLMDGELSEQEVDALLEQVSRDNELRNAWSRQHLASTVLHETGPVMPIEASFADQVMAALEADEQPPAKPRKVVPLRNRNKAGRQRPRWQRPVAGLAVAASVAAVAVLVVQRPQAPVHQAAPQVATTAPATQSSAPAVQASTVAVSAGAPQTDLSAGNAVEATPSPSFDGLFRVVSSDHWTQGFVPAGLDFPAGGVSAAQGAPANSINVSQPDQRQALEGFWLNHNSYTNDAGLSSMMGYMHLTAQESAGSVPGR